MKKPFIAALLNIIPGLGYLYLGIRKVFAYLLLVSTAISFAIPPSFFNNPLEMMWPIIASSILLQIALMVDVYLEAKNK